MSGFCKIGNFSDGGGRIRIVKQGYDADPAPADVRNIIYDSDWPEVLLTANGYYGNFVSDSKASNVTINFPQTLPFTPTRMFQANPAKVQNGTNPGGGFNGSGGTTYTFSDAIIADLQNAYSVNAGNLSSATASGATLKPGAASSNNMWAVLLNDFTSTAATASRGGTQWMKMDSGELIIAKPGKSISSSNIFDFIMPPANLGGVITQPVLSGTVSSIPWVGNSTENVDQGVGVSPRYVTYNGSDYCLTIPHNLGYVPICYFTTYYDFRTASSNLTASMGVDAQNIYIYSVLHTPQGSSGNPLAINTLSYFVLRARWI